MPGSSSLIDGVSTKSWFALEDGDAWIARAGYVDLFLSPSTRENTVRWHVARIDAGAIFTGLPAASLGLALTAHPGPSCELERVDPDSLPAHSTERWIAQLAESCDGPRAPKEFISLEPGLRVEGGEQGSAVFPTTGVAWVRQISGRSLLQGTDRHVLPAGARIPVTRGFWLLVEPGAEIESERESSPAALARLSTAAIDLLNERRAREESRERLRLAAKQRAARIAFEDALDELRSPLGDEQEAAVHGRHSSAAIRACEIIASGFGATVIPSSNLAANPRSIVLATAASSGIRTRQVLLRDRWWQEGGGTMIAFREEDNAPMVLSADSGRYRIIDPVTGTGVAATAGTAKPLHAIAYMLYRPFPSQGLGLSALLRFGFRGCGADALTLLFLGSAAGLLSLAPAIATQLLFDSVIVSAERSQLTLLAAGLVAAAVGSALLQLSTGFASLRIEGRMAASLQTALWDRLLSLPATFFREFTSGDLASRSMAIERIRHAITGAVITSAVAAVFSLFQLAVLFRYSASMAIGSLALLSVSILVSAFCGWAEIRYQRRVIRCQGKLAGLVSQLLNGIAKIRVAGAERLAFGNWAHLFAEREKLGVKARNASSILTVWNSAFPVLAIAWVHWAASTASDGAAMRPGEFLAFVTAFQTLLFATLQVSASVVPVLSVVPEYERAKPILETIPENQSGRLDPGVLSGEVEVNQVSFRYRPDLPPVLRDVSFRVRPGEFVAFAGESGSGKSTIFRILLGFERPESGAVYYDNQALHGLDIPAVRRQIGTVLQNGQLMAGDLFGNITGSLPLSIEDAWEAARMAGLDEDIRRMPMGMHTLLSEGGGGLSGGQRQRLLIARAIVTRPPILLFDEATSALDNATQAIVSESLERLKATRIVIAHRLSTIRNADRIFVMHRGRIAETGNYEQLMAANGLFAEIARRQTAEGIE